MERKWIGLWAVILASLGGWTYEHSNEEESSRIDSLYYMLLQNNTVASIIYELWKPTPGGIYPLP